MTDKEGKMVKKRRSYGAQSVHERKQRRRRIVFSKKSEKETSHENNVMSSTRPFNDCKVANNHTSAVPNDDRYCGDRPAHKSSNSNKKNDSVSSKNPSSSNHSSLRGKSMMLSQLPSSQDDNNQDLILQRHSYSTCSTGIRRIKNTKSVLETSSSISNSKNQSKKQNSTTKESHEESQNHSSDDNMLQHRRIRSHHTKLIIDDSTEASSNFSQDNESENEFNCDNDINQNTTTQKSQKVIYRGSDDVLTFDSIKMYKRAKTMSKASFELSNDMIENTTPSPTLHQDSIEESSSSSGDDNDNNDPSYCMSQLTQEQIQAKPILKRNASMKKGRDLQKRKHDSSLPYATQKHEESKPLSTENRRDNVDEISNEQQGSKTFDDTTLLTTQKHQDDDDKMSNEPQEIDLNQEVTGKDNYNNSHIPLYSELIQLCDSFNSISLTTMQKRMNSSASKNGIRKLTSMSKLILQKMEECNSLPEYDNPSTNADQDSVTKTIGGIFQSAMSLCCKYKTSFSQGIVLVSSLLRYQLKLRGFEKIHEFYNDNQHHSIVVQPLVKIFEEDAMIIDSLFGMIGELVSHRTEKESVYGEYEEVESLLASFLCFLHAIPTHTITNRLKVSSQDGRSPIWMSLSRLISHIPQFESYSEVEACVAFVHKLRCTLLSSLGYDNQNRQYEDQDCILATITRLHSSLHTAFLDGIDRVGPMIPLDIHRQLYPETRTRAQLSFADWSRGVISSLQQEGLCENVSSFSCNGVCKFAIQNFLSYQVTVYSYTIPYSICKI